MSSRILPLSQDALASPLPWRSVGGMASSEPSGPDTSSTQNQPRQKGPGIEEFQALEKRIAELQHQIPLREQQARQAGFKEGEAAAAARWEQAVERLSRSIAEMSALRGKMRREAEEDVVRLSMAMARRVLRRELTVDPEALLGLVKAALDRIDLRETHRVRVRPEDASLVSMLLQRIGSPHVVEVTPDPGLERGGAVFETTRGNLDASVETQLEEIERGFADLMRRPAPK